MNKNFVRISVGSLLGIVILTVLMLVLENPNTLLWFAYGWCVWALIVFAISLGFWSTGNKIRYVLYAAYPLVVKSYLFKTLLIAIIFGALSILDVWTIGWGWFCLIELVVMAHSVWRLQAMDTAKDEILTVEESVKISIVSWKMLVADITAIGDKVAEPDKKIVNHTVELMRYADPVEHDAVRQIVQDISEKISELKKAVESCETEKITDLCAVIDRLVKERADKLMIIK